MVDELYVYDGWNVVLVLNRNASNAVTRRYTWGLDLSGLAGQGAAGSQGAAGFSPRGPSDGATAGIHNAGGIGGLLAVEAPQAVGDPLRHWYFYDSNGNVGQLLAYDATGPTVNATPAAHYEYDPYGQLVNWTDTIANPFRFSTKWFDAETGLGYWGHRYYSPRLGRWMSRDPIDEADELLLFSYVGNAAVIWIDPVGLQATQPSGDDEDPYGWCEEGWVLVAGPTAPPTYSDWGDDRMGYIVFTLVQFQRRTKKSWELVRGGVQGGCGRGLSGNSAVSFYREWSTTAGLGYIFQFGKSWTHGKSVTHTVNFNEAADPQYEYIGKIAAETVELQEHWRKAFDFKGPFSTPKTLHHGYTAVVQAVVCRRKCCPATSSAPS